MNEIRGSTGDTAFHLGDVKYSTHVPSAAAPDEPRAREATFTLTATKNKIAKGLANLFFLSWLIFIFLHAEQGVNLSNS